MLSAKPADLMSIYTCFVVFARNTEPDRLSFLSQPRLLLRHITALPQRSQRNRRQRLQSVTSFSMMVFDTPPPVAITVRAGIRAPFSTSTTYGLLSQTSLVPLVMSISAPNFCAWWYAQAGAPDQRYRWEIPNNFRFLSLNLPGRPASSFPASEHQVLLKRHTLPQPTQRDRRR